jgi:hypothetical protein
MSHGQFTTRIRRTRSSAYALAVRLGPEVIAVGQFASVAARPPRSHLLVYGSTADGYAQTRDMDRTERSALQRLFQPIQCSRFVVEATHCFDAVFPR